MPAPVHDEAFATPTSWEDGVRRLPDRWLPRAGELAGFAERWLDGWNRHDVDALAGMVTDDVTWDDPAMFGETVRGREEFRTFTQLFFDAFPDVRVAGLGSPYVSLDGRRIAVRSRLWGTFAGELRPWSREGPRPGIPPTGRPFDVHAVDLYELRDGRVAEWALVYDLATLARQIGLGG
jgi:steroid delta-isomerase-like uncharacterized protein